MNWREAHISDDSPLSPARRKERGQRKTSKKERSLCHCSALRLWECFHIRDCDPSREITGVSLLGELVPQSAGAWVAARLQIPAWEWDGCGLWPQRCTSTSVTLDQLHVSGCGVPPLENGGDGRDFLGCLALQAGGGVPRAPTQRAAAVNCRCCGGTCQPLSGEQGQQWALETWQWA